jgi:hypothetical protein
MTQKSGRVKRGMAISMRMWNIIWNTKGKYS